MVIYIIEFPLFYSYPQGFSTIPPGGIPTVETQYYASYYPGQPVVSPNGLYNYVPPDAYNAPPDAYNVPPDGYNVPPDAYNVPPEAYNVSPDAYNVSQAGPPAPSSDSKFSTSQRFNSRLPHNNRNNRGHRSMPNHSSRNPRPDRNQNQNPEEKPLTGRERYIRNHFNPNYRKGDAPYPKTFSRQQNSSKNAQKKNTHINKMEAYTCMICEFGTSSKEVYEEHVVSEFHLKKEARKEELRQLSESKASNTSLEEEISKVSGEDKSIQVTTKPKEKNVNYSKLIEVPSNLVLRCRKCERDCVSFYAYMSHINGAKHLKGSNNKDVSIVPQLVTPNLDDNVRKFLCKAFLSDLRTSLDFKQIISKL